MLKKRTNEKLDFIRVLEREIRTIRFYVCFYKMPGQDTRIMRFYMGFLKMLKKKLRMLLK
jgi:hypothetical protein